MTVYKYLHSARTDVLEYSRIRFTQASALNDPFESLPSLAQIRHLIIAEMVGKEQSNSGTSLLERVTMERIEAGADTEVNKLLEMTPQIADQFFLLLSLSSKNDDLLMWSHYSDSHRGFVVGFDENCNFIKDGPVKGSIGLRPVEYTDQRFELPSQRILGLPHSEQMSAIVGIMFTKSLAWSYECELRVLASPKSANPSKDSFNRPCYLFSFPPESVIEIILGCAAQPTVRQEIADIARTKYPNAGLFQARIHAEKFALDIVEVP